MSHKARPPNDAVAPGADSGQGAADRATSTLASRLAERILDPEVAGLDGDTSSYTKALVLSCLGAMVGGSTLPAGAAVSRYVAGQGGVHEATIVGSGTRTSAELAAFANATFAHATEYEDDSFPEAVTTFTVIPPLLAVAERHHIDGRRFIEAVVVAHETQSRLGRVCLPALDRGFQLLPIMGAIGTAAGVARLLDLSRDEAATAMSIAASYASGLRVQYRYATHFLESGHSARSGIVAAYLAGEGLDAALDVFEGTDNQRFSFLAMLGCEDPQAPALLDGWGQPLRILDVGIKRYPACFLLQPLAQALMDMKRSRRFGTADVASVAVHGNDSLRKCDIPRPASSSEALQSTEHVAAASLYFDALTMDKFVEPVLSDQTLAALRGRVHFAERADWPQGVLAAPVHVAVTLSSGEIIESTTYGVAGLPPRPRLAWDEVVAKFDDATGAALEQSAKRQIIDVVAESEGLDDMASLASTLVRST